MFRCCQLFIIIIIIIVGDVIPISGKHKIITALRADVMIEVVIVSMVKFPFNATFRTGKHIIPLSGYAPQGLGGGVFELLAPPF